MLIHKNGFIEDSSLNRGETVMQFDDQLITREGFCGLVIVEPNDSGVKPKLPFVLHVNHFFL